MVVHSARSKNARRVEYPIKGRPIHRESEAPRHANYSPNYKAIQGKNPSATIGKCQKEMLYNIEMKEVRARQGPSTYRPNYERVLKQLPRATLSKTRKRSYIDENLPEGAGKYYEKQHTFGSDSLHGVITRSKRRIHDITDGPGVCKYAADKLIVKSNSPSVKFYQQKKICFELNQQTSERVGPGAYNTID